MERAVSQAVLGWTADEAVGQPAAIICTIEDRERHQDRWETETAFAEGLAPNNRWHVRKVGRACVHRETTRALRNLGGSLRGFLKIGQNVTERRRTEEQLRESEAVLRRLNETLEAQVNARTAELHEALRTLRNEVAQREHPEHQLRQSEKLKAIGQLTGGIAPTTSITCSRR